MKKSFRAFLCELEAAGELRRIKKPVDVRDVSALIAQSSQATLFEALKEYPGWQLAGALAARRCSGVDPQASRPRDGQL